MKRAIALMLALLMLTMSVAACGGKAAPEETTTAASAEGTTTAPVADTTTAAPEETLPPELQDTLPDVKFTGETFKVLIREESKYEMTSEEITGDLVAHEHGDLLQKLTEILGAGIYVSQNGQLMLNERMVNNVKLCHVSKSFQKGVTQRPSRGRGSGS